MSTVQVTGLPGQPATGHGQPTKVTITGAGAGAAIADALNAQGAPTVLEAAIDNTLEPSLADDQEPGEPLFDTTPYWRETPKIDGKESDKVKVTFGGGFDLDVMIADDLAFYNALRLGHTVTLQVEAEVAAKAGKSKFDKDANEVVTAVAALRVVSAVRIAPEDL